MFFEISFLFEFSVETDMQVTGELRHLESFFEDEHRRFLDGGNGRSMVELYETVQHAGNIIPRLFLLMTIGSVYIRTKEVPAKEILFDLVELCRGVQHPMRGLFLRNYLSLISKDKLPDVGSEYEGYVLNHLVMRCPIPFRVLTI
jgi:vacuolar protein sorting-associated protein 35